MVSPVHNTLIKSFNAGNSLAVQWLGLGAFTAGTRFDRWSGN